MLVSTIGLLIMLRVTGNVIAATHLVLGICVITMASGSLAQTPLNSAEAFFLCMVPPLAAFFVPPRAAIVFAIADTGPGISEELRGLLFQPFQQGDPSRTRRFAGTGLGLSLSRQLAVLMGGTLTFDPLVSPGARFILRLPLPQVAVVQRRDTPRPAGPGVAPKSPFGVLIVDENAINRLVASAMVSRAGFEVKLASSGLEALTDARTGQWAAILMDVMMPGTDGLEATREIRKLDGLEATVPIIALTASAMPSELGECVAAGMNGVLTKPLSFDKLTEALGSSTVQTQPRCAPGCSAGSWVTRG